MEICNVCYNQYQPNNNSNNRFTFGQNMFKMSKDIIKVCILSS